MVAVALLCGALTCQNVVFSTHDSTFIAGKVPAREAWADVKMPGGFPVATAPAAPPTTVDTRYTFVVGTIEVDDTTGATPFSAAGASCGTAVGTVATGPNPFTLGPGQGPTRQVVMVQANDYANTNRLQVFFYGSLNNGMDPEFPTRATNGRAISVWRGPLNTDMDGLDGDDRIAICGETYDDVLPGSQAPGGWAPATNTPSGFIAVYDGNGVLLWTHHFFDPAAPDSDCAITDLSIRVDAAGNDVVTYCGISSHAVPAGGELSPLLPFAPLPLPFPGALPTSGGATPRPGDQWDGFVGRLVRPPGLPVQLNGPVAARVFHSVVGGGAQDGLFGIDEIDADRFVVVGSTIGDDTMPVGDYFPYSVGAIASVPQPGGPPSVTGAVLFFDASTLATTGLRLTRSTMLGTPAVVQPGAPSFTMARDVRVVRNTDVLIDATPGPAPPEDLIYVVGSTSDPVFNWNLFQPWLALPPAAQAALLGPTDGFIAVLRENGNGVTFSYDGGPGDDGLTGVNAWSEFPEYVAVTGFSEVAYTIDPPSASVDILVSSYFYNNAYGPANPVGNTAPPNGTDQILRLRTTVIGGRITEDRPTTMGPRSATQTGTAGAILANAPPFDNRFPGIAGFVNLNTRGQGNVFVGQEAGGGVAVGPDGRINVVGRCDDGTNLSPQGYPVLGGGRFPVVNSWEAVRTEMDLLPPTAPFFPFPIPTTPGVARTDGTGFQALTPGFPPAPVPPATTTPFTGGTTPHCLLAEFGEQIGMPAPSLARMLIEVEGAIVSGATTNDAIIVSRPPFQTGGFAVGALQINAPTGGLFVPGGLAEIWTPAAALVVPAVMAAGRAFRWPLPPLPGFGGQTLSAQFIGVLVAPISGALPACSSTLVTSPCIWFTY
jgi:hypothetical protein